MTTQINQLTELTTTSDGDLLLIRESATGVDKKMQAQNLRAKATTKDDVGLGNVDNVSAADLRDRSTHTGTQTLSTISDAGTIASQNANSVNIDGGNIDGTPIGVSSASSGAFTTLTASGNVGVGTLSPNVYNPDARNLVLAEPSDSAGMTIRAASTLNANIIFSDSDDSSVSGLIQYNMANDFMRMSTNGQEAMRIDSSGHAIIPAGVTLGTAAGVYNAANTLDDYEEGTWTPTGNGITFSTAAGRYVKIGRICILSFRVIWPTNSDSNQADINGQPFTAAGPNEYGGGFISFENNTYTQLNLYLGSTTNFRPVNAGTTNLTNANWSGKQLQGTMIYEVA